MGAARGRDSAAVGPDAVRVGGRTGCCWGWTRGGRGAVVHARVAVAYPRGCRSVRRPRRLYPRRLGRDARARGGRDIPAWLSAGVGRTARPVGRGARVGAVRRARPPQRGARLGRHRRYAPGRPWCTRRGCPSSTAAPPWCRDGALPAACARPGRGARGCDIRRARVRLVGGLCVFHPQRTHAYPLLAQARVRVLGARTRSRRRCLSPAARPPGLGARACPRPQCVYPLGAADRPPRAPARATRAPPMLRAPDAPTPTEHPPGTRRIRPA